MGVGAVGAGQRTVGAYPCQRVHPRRTGAQTLPRQLDQSTSAGQTGGGVAATAAGAHALQTAVVAEVVGGGARTEALA